jgi:hypothetical protein
MNAAGLRETTSLLSGAGQGGLDQFATLLTEVIGLQVEVIVVPQATTAQLAKQATTTIPVVVAGANFVE